APGHDRDVLRTDGNPACGGHVGGHGFTQLRIALRGSVMRPALIESSLGGFDDVGGRGEIGLADLEMDHAVSRRLERPRTHQYLKSGFDKNPVHPFGQLHSHFLKNGTPSRVSTSATRSSIETRSPSTRPVTRPPLSSETIATW